MPRSSRSRSSRKRRPAGGRLRRVLRAGTWTLLGLLLAGAGVGVLYVQNLDREIRAQFEGQRWALPARVYARPLELYPGRRLDRERLVTELEALNYQRSGKGARAGEYEVNDGTVALTTRPFTFGDGPEPARSVRVQMDRGHVRSITDRDTGAAVDLMRVEPLLIGSIYPTHGEDRVVVDLDEVPPALIGALIAIEDRRFMSHRGVDPAGIARAAWANLRAGRTVQGGSTLTQQLVKNFYLTREQTLSRKLNEAVMALILEHRYSKEAILEAYVNEVFLGQAGERAIHGFGQAARFYYQRPLNELRLDQLALLVGLARGASYYDPRRHPERARARRDRVLNAMHETGLADADTVATARGMPLDVSPAMPGGSRFPAFLDLVRRELRAEYADEDLRSDGLRIFTSLDPVIQLAVEERVREEVAAVAPRAGEHAEELQAAAVVTDARSGEVLALVGDRNPAYPGFNRAVEARRQIGSLVKPFVYLAALTNPRRYTLASLLEDRPVTLQLAHGEPWTPRNFDREHRGEVTAWEALVQSYNVPTVRLADRIGVSQLVDILQTFGLQATPAPNPSLALGALELSPLQVAGLYQGLASGGYATGTRAIRDVLDADDEVLSHYGLELRGAVPDGAVRLLGEALHDVTVDGTGRAIGQRLPQRRLAGKTGTTNDFRDAWFAGYDDRHVGVVWLGMDDNRATGLTGGSGAAPVWAGIMGELPGGSIEEGRHPSIEYHEIDLDSAARIVDEDHACERVRRLPFWQNSAPEAVAECEGEADGDAAGWFGRMFRNQD
ncbi:penicillin-binding protein 1B [Thioalkalivibrio halophilus]|uniref:Penicillin-binding protein 1B n=1 Tax=Thioalkalivibrio halophilus TaxID=252474 RepID=A0A1V2ZYI7_9GAMM|nr:penicillin-binding protein 1B [Thioalkalivibrio halophilus]OOC10135.1 penicillin-binding protein 1B [Thioalkalivibrio halophilus]